MVKQTLDFNYVFRIKEITESKQPFLCYQLEHIYIVKEDTPFLVNLHFGHDKTTSQVIIEIEIVHLSILRFESKPSMFIAFQLKEFLSHVLSQKIERLHSEKIACHTCYIEPQIC